LGRYKASKEKMIVKFDSMFVVKGQGVILSGEVEEGEISIGQKVTLTSPKFSLDIRVKGLEIERKINSKAKQG
jgi:selenocysteine-specific translation elongation factor